jgi:DNA invertase Pin-like site-specific DNA recombinase
VDHPSRAQLRHRTNPLPHLGRGPAGGEVPSDLVFTDNDISAFTGVLRPDYERLMAAIKRGVVSTVIVFQTSRLWRAE